MKQELSTKVVVAVVVVVLAAAVGILVFVQPRVAPKVYGLEPPSAADRQKATAQMGNDMREAMTHRPGQRGGQ